jgi:diguanylate cyclase (GGDEF)-like protein/PAS domain S-box-containing protein
MNRVRFLLPTLPIIIGTLVLVGWFLDIASLRQGITSSVAMNPATATGFILLGLEALRLYTGNNNPWFSRAGQLAICVVLLAAAMKLGDLVLGASSGIDQLLFSAQLDREPLHPNRMAPNTALCLFLLGCAMQTMRSRSKAAIPIAQALAVIPALLTLLAIVGYIYGVKSFYGIASYIPMAFNTAIAFMFLTAAILFAHPHQGYLRVLSSRDSAGKVASILLPATLIVPFLVGWITLAALNAKLFDPALDHALSVVVNVAVFFALSYISIRTLYFSDLRRQKAEAGLREQKEFLHSVFENALDAVVLMDSNGAITGWSSQAENIFGWRKEDAVGLLMHETIVPARYREAHIRGMKHFLSSGEGPVLNTRIEIFALHRDGHEFPIELSISPIKTEEGYEFSAFIRDISERKRLELQLAESEALFRAIFDQAPSGIELIDPETLRFVEANPAACRMLGYTHEEFLNLRLADTQADMNEEALAEVVRELDVSGGAIIENRHRCKNGDILDVEINARMLELPDKRLLVGVWRDITERKRAEESLAAREREFRTLAENAPDNIARYDCNARTLYVNPALERILGRTLADLLGKTPMEHGASGIFDEYQKAILHVGATGESIGLEQIIPVQNGRPRIHSIRMVAEMGVDGVPVGVLAVGRDISEIKWAEENLRITASVFGNSQEGIVITDANNNFLDVNPAFTRITGYSREEVIGKNPRLLNSGRQDKAFYTAMWQSLLQEKAWRGEIWNRRKSGEVYAELLSIAVICDDKGKVQRYVGVFSDISYIKAHETALSQVANYDALTGIPNRRLLSDRLDQAIARAQRSGKLLSVCYIDLDGFKQVNDQYGHEAGDQLLVEVTRRLQEALRAGDTLARLGGDEFVVLFNDLASELECRQILDRILEIVAIPAVIGNHEVTVSSSIGVTFFTSASEDGDTLLRQADQAMYVAKQSGKNRYHQYDPEHWGG